MWPPDLGFAIPLSSNEIPFYYEATLDVFQIICHYVPALKYEELSLSAHHSIFKDAVIDRLRGIGRACWLIIFVDASGGTGC